MRISYEKVPAEMKRDSLHSGKVTRAENAARRRKDERLEERSIRQRLIAPVITTNSHPLGRERGQKEVALHYPILCGSA